MTGAPEGPTDLPKLFASRKAWAGSTRAMSERAAAAGYRLSHTQFAAYARGDYDALPSEDTRRAIAAGLGVSFEEVTAAAWAGIAPTLPGGLTSQHAIAFLRLTEGRTDEEIRTTLSAVEVVLKAADAGRAEASREAAALPDNSDGGT